MRNAYDRKQTRTHAGRRSAGLGGDGGVQPGAHPGGVRGRGERAICSAVDHKRLLTARKCMIFVYCVVLINDHIRNHPAISSSDTSNFFLLLVKSRKTYIPFR